MAGALALFEVEKGGSHPKPRNPYDPDTGVCKTLSPCAIHFLGSPVVAFPLSFGSRFTYKVANPDKGALIRIWLLGYKGFEGGEFMGGRYLGSLSKGSLASLGRGTFGYTPPFEPPSLKNPLSSAGTRSHQSRGEPCRTKQGGRGIVTLSPKSWMVSVRARHKP